MKAIKITPAGDASVVELAAPLYDSLPDALGGWIEHVKPPRLPDPYCMIVDEEGRLKGLSRNSFGCWLYGDTIVGDVYLLQDGWTDDEPDIVGLTDQDIATLTAMFGGLWA